MFEVIGGGGDSVGLGFCTGLSGGVILIDDGASTLGSGLLAIEVNSAGGGCGDLVIGNSNSDDDDGGGGGGSWDIDSDADDRCCNDEVGGVGGGGL